MASFVAAVRARAVSRPRREEVAKGSVTLAALEQDVGGSTWLRPTAPAATTKRAWAMQFAPFPAPTWGRGTTPATRTGLLHRRGNHYEKGYTCTGARCIISADDRFPAYSPERGVLFGAWGIDGGQMPVPELKDH